MNQIFVAKKLKNYTKGELMIKQNKLIGFIFLGKQEEFEKFQLDNPTYVIMNVVPHMSRLEFEFDTVTAANADAEPEWGVFVTYSYEEQIK